MIFFLILSAILMIFSFIFYRQHQLNIAKPLFIVSAIMMIATLIIIYWAASKPYP